MIRDLIIDVLLWREWIKMKILAIDSSGMTASVAVITDDCLVGEYTINFKKTHSQTLLPMIDTIVKFLDMDMNEFDAIAISEGPGSFTGLRIGAATAKGLGLALNKPLIGISTLAGLAYNMCGSERIICPIMDARRNQAYSGLYCFEYDCETREYQLVEESAPKAADILEIIEEINKIGKGVVFVGDGIKVFADTIKDNIKVSYLLAPIHKREQSAASVGALAMQYLKNNNTVTADEFEPVYLRMSQAEREYKEKHNLI